MIPVNGQYQLLPPLSDTEYTALDRDIRSRGLMVPVEIDEFGAILDGHHRVAICESAGIDWRATAIRRAGWTEAEKQLHVRKLNILRRHLDPLAWADQFEAFAAERGVVLGKGGDRRSTDTLSVDTADALAEELGVNPRTARRRLAAKRAVEAQPEILERYNAGLIDAQTASQQARNMTRTSWRVERANSLGSSPTLAIGTFDVLYADPPWRYEHVESENRAIENQYPTMNIDAICALKVPAADNSLLFLWATSPKLAEAMTVLTAWGFDYRTNLVWVKDRIGMGYYARQRHELLLIARRGSPAVPAPSSLPDSVIEAPREEHSVKPSIVYEIIERMYPNARRVELFARSERQGWTAWGNEVG